MYSSRLSSRWAAGALLTGFLMLGIMTGCSGDSSDTDTTAAKREAELVSRARFENKGYSEQQISDLLLIEEEMQEVLTRWRYHDKAGIYDNEFEYVRDRYTLTEYLNLTKIKVMIADSLMGYEVTGGQFFGRDSVIVDDIVKFVGPSGKPTNFVNKDKLFWHQGRWIRPTLSQKWEQIEFEDMVRQADSAAAAEESEGY